MILMLSFGMERGYWNYFWLLSNKFDVDYSKGKQCEEIDIFLMISNLSKEFNFGAIISSLWKDGEGKFGRFGLVYLFW